MCAILTIGKRITPQFSFVYQRYLSKHRTAPKMSENIDALQNSEKALRPFRVSVEGNIGAGKSSVIKYLAQQPLVEVYHEPIDWWRNLNGHNLLQLLYTDINKWYIVFQKYVQLTRLQIQTCDRKNLNTTTHIFERSLQNNRYCFVEQARSAGYLKSPDFEVLDEWFQWINDNIDIDINYIVYLRTSPEVVFQRMQKRGREEENSIPFDYIKDLHTHHEKWLFSNDSHVKRDRLLVIDADKPLDYVLKQCEENMDKIVSQNLVRRSRFRNILKT